ncbi:MAG TPA: DUF3667 domain-containing protein [Caulobacteraceae bacterium]|jgi:hypothetical protein
MAHEIEAAQLEAIADLARARRKTGQTAPKGTPCANCGAVLAGPWCHDCGQLGEDFHRSWLHLAAESLEGILHVDGRLWRTLPTLALRPARLTRAYLEGHRAPQIPPLRLFLVVLLLVFFLGSLNPGHGSLFGAPHGHPPMTARVANQNVRFVYVPDRAHGMSEAQKAQLKAQLSDVRIGFGRGSDPAASAWFRDRIYRVIDNPEAYKLVLESWSERFAFLMLPIAALLLSLLFVFQRRFYLFDHLIFSMHSLSFLGLLFAAVTLLSMVVGGAAGLLYIAAPVHLFAHMRGVYGSSAFGTLARMALLFIGSLFGFIVLMAGLMLVGLTAL